MSELASKACATMAGDRTMKSAVLGGVTGVDLRRRPRSAGASVWAGMVDGELGVAALLVMGGVSWTEGCFLRLLRVMACGSALVSVSAGCGGRVLVRGGVKDYSETGVRGLFLQLLVCCGVGVSAGVMMQVVWIGLGWCKHKDVREEVP